MLGRHDVVTHSRDTGVFHCAAKVIGVDDFTKSGFYDWWATQEDAANSFDHDDFIAEGGHIRSTCSATAKHDGELRKTTG